MKRDSVEIKRKGDGYRLWSDGGGVADLTVAELRWLCLVAGPALLVEHDPLPAFYSPPKPTHGL